VSEGLAARRAALAALTAPRWRAPSRRTAPGRTSPSRRPSPDSPTPATGRFAAHLAYDTLRWEGTLDWALGHVLTRPLDDVEPALRRVLRLGALQLLRTDVPARAAVATSVALAREAVPRAARRAPPGSSTGCCAPGPAARRPALAGPDDDPVGHLALTTGHPAGSSRTCSAGSGDRARGDPRRRRRPPG
jgi:16S rRNA (cytosine967-C5)-methyltransferase